MHPALLLLLLCKVSYAIAVLRKTELGKRVNEMPGTLVSSMCSPGLGSHPVGIAYICSLLQAS